MTKVLGLLGFIAELKTIEADAEHLAMAVAMKAGAMVAKQAKAQIGKDHEEWPRLAESTIVDKQRHGYKTPAPLLRTGELRDSISWTAQPTRDGAEVANGSDLEMRFVKKGRRSPENSYRRKT